MPRQPSEVPDATLRLLLASGLGPVTLKKLRQRIGSDEQIVAAAAAHLARVRGLGPASAEALRRAIDETRPQLERDAMARSSARAILLGDDDYPPALAALPDAPAALWLRGELRREDRLALAVIGSRRCTTYGREQAGRFSSLLAGCGLTIVSGGALGIDGEAHRGALRGGGRTIVVLGSGLDNPYPPQHARLFEEIAAGGSAVVSEYPMGMPPRAEHFPRRNRIISGLSLGVLVVEAAARSGALITARLAAEEHGREVMVVPGRLDSPSSAGALEALRDGWAAVVLSHTDVLHQLEAARHLIDGALAAQHHADAASGKPAFEENLTSGQRRVLEVMRQAGAALRLDRISARTGTDVGRLLADLTLLEIRGLVQREQGGFALRPQRARARHDATAQ